MSNDRDGLDPGVYQGVVPSERPKNIVAQRAPTTNDRRYKIGTLWIDKANNASYQLTSVVAASANWQVLGSDSGAVATITGDTGGALSPSGGNINILGTAAQGLSFAGSGASLTGTIANASDSQKGVSSYQLSDFTVTAGNVALNENLPSYAEVTLTAAQVKALAATPIELVAAPGAGKVVKLIGAQLKLDYGGTNAFTEAGDNLVINYTDGAGVAVSQTIEMTGFIDQTADMYTNAEPKIDAIVTAAASENQALVLWNNNAEIAGNAANDNQLIVSVLYRVVSI